MKNVDKPAIAKIISEMIAADTLVSNEEMAEAVRSRLGIEVSRKDISSLRTEIGLNSYQLAFGSASISKINGLNDDQYYQDLALSLTVTCVRNTVIEDYHAQGKLSQSEMKAFNIEVSNKLYTALQVLFNPAYRYDRDNLVRLLSYNYPNSWQEPTLDAGLLSDNNREKEEFGLTPGTRDH